MEMRRGAEGIPFLVERDVDGTEFLRGGEEDIAIAIFSFADSFEMDLMKGCAENRLCGDAVSNHLASERKRRIRNSAIHPST
jgi:hypothetical protein